MTDAEHKLLKEVMDKKAQIKEQADKISQLEAVTKALDELGGLDAIKQMVQAKKDAEKKDLDIVLNKTSVISGGVDITEAVIDLVK